MRSFIIISAFFTLISFSSTALPILNEGRLVITGQITNAKTKTISLTSIELTGREKHTVKLDEAGRFYFAIDILSPHDNYLSYNNKLVTFFAYPNDSIYIEADGNDFRNTIKYSGQRAKFNQCLSIFFSDFGNFLEENRYFGHQNPYDFLAGTNELKSHMNEKIDSISRNMKPEKAAIDWMYSYVKYKAAEELFQYGRHHKGELPQEYFDFVNDLEGQKITTQIYGILPILKRPAGATPYRLPASTARRVALLARSATKSPSSASARAASMASFSFVID